MISQTNKKTKAGAKEKIIVIVGQTATGKSDLAVRLAKKFNGEVISADSGQVYKGLKSGTGKITKKEMRGVPHHMLDIADPRRIYTVNQYKNNADQIIRYIVRKEKVPIVVGGTGFYINALLGTIQLPNIPPNKKLRTRLQKKTAGQLYAELKKRDPRRAKTIDMHNTARLIRAIEIVSALGKVPPLKTAEKKYDVLNIGLRIPDKELKQKIRARLLKRLAHGMLAEVKQLHRPPSGRGVSWKRMEELGLEYRYLARYLQGTISKNEMAQQLNAAIWHYARRQKTWFKKDATIQWFHPREYKKIAQTIQKFL